jgi:hypothetical protein
MPSHTLKTTFLIAMGGFSVGMPAQNIHKCGDTYSQMPCPGGDVINTADPRTPAQKIQSDLTTSRNAKAADALEKTRLKQEKMDAAASAPPIPSTSSGIERTPSMLQKEKQKKKTPGYFTAQTPGKKTPPQKNRDGNKAAGKS